MVYSVNHQLLLLLRADLLRAFYYSFSHNAQSLFSFRLAVNIIQPRAIARRIQNGDTKSGCLLFFFFFLFFKKVRIWQGNTPTLSLSLFKRTSTLPDVAGEEVFTKSINY